MLSLLCPHRPEYGCLQEVASHFPTIPIMALTATATPDNKRQLLQILRKPKCEISTVNKPNISFRAIELKHLPKSGMNCTVYTVCTYVYIH